ncbi:MAG: short-chain dehydrogenase/reductase [Pseudomonadota bacterium]
MDLQLTGKRVLITGASKGIGYACALSFVREGASPILVARSAEGLEQAAASIKSETGVTVETVAMDLGAAEGAQSLAQRVGDVDILINNAGSIPGGDLTAVDDARWRAGWELKVYGYINLTREYLPRMEARGQGVIVNIIGMAGVANRYAYVCGSAANAALIAFTNGVGSASPDHGVRVFGINPSPTRTERIVHLHTPDKLEKIRAALPFGRLMEPEEVAHLAVFGCSPLCGYLSGTVINLDGGQLYR